MRTLEEMEQEITILADRISRLQFSVQHLQEGEILQSAINNGMVQTIESVLKVACQGKERTDGPSVVTTDNQSDKELLPD